MFRHYLHAVLVIAIPSSALLAAPRSKTPNTNEIQEDVRKAQNSLVRKYEGLLKDYENSTTMGLRDYNRAKRMAITPMYVKLYNVSIPHSPADSAAPDDELKNLTDGKLYADAWLKFVSGATLNSSDYYIKDLSPILTDPHTDRGAVMRIQADADNAWRANLSFAVQKFTDDSTQIAADFATQLNAIAHDHKDLRDAISSIVGPVSVDDFDKNLDKYITMAEAKMKPSEPENPPAPAPAVTASPTPASGPAAISLNPQTANVDDKLNELSSKLAEQKQSLDAIRKQAQSLDDNYPILHHEVSEQIEKLRSDIFWLRLVLVIVGTGMFVGIGLALLAFDRASGNSTKQDPKKKRASQTPGEEPMKAILGRIYKLEQELAELRGRIPEDESLLPGEDKKG